MEVYVMRVRNILIPLILIIFAAAGVTNVSAQGSDWKRLGDKDVSHTLDHDTIDTNEKGAVREIRLSVMKAPVKFSKIVINYEDGTKQDVEFLESIDMGKNSRSIAIMGDGKVIKSVDVWYETSSMGGKQAQVVVYGRSGNMAAPNAPVSAVVPNMSTEPLSSTTAPMSTTKPVAAVVASPEAGGWKKLGDENVGFDVDHDSIGVNDGSKIRELRLRVMDAPVKFRKIVIKYKDGSKQDVEFVEEIPMGQDSRSVMIEGDGRVIDAVDFWYETATMAGKKASVILYGRS
jgi:hypothetical protein